MTDEATLKPTAQDYGTRPKMARTAAVSGFFGTTLEFYDFLIYGTAAALFFGKIFFPDPSLGVLAALGTFGIAYAARPFGAVLWGHLGDRIGRKRVLMMILLTMGVSTFLVGCIPSYGSIGMLAPVLLVLLRVIQGISAGGEQTGSALIAMEHAPDHRRAFFTSWTMCGSNAGNVLASIVFLPLIAILPDDELLAWGWRIPFWLSAIVLLITYIMRRKLTESATFEEVKKKDATSQVPLFEVLRWHWRTVLRVVTGSLSITLNSLFVIFGVSYATNNMGLSRSYMLLLVAAAGVLSIVTQPLWAMLSDRIGRKPVFVTGLLGCAVLFPFFLKGISTRNWALIWGSGLTMMVLFWTMASALLIVTFVELFPAHIRYTGMALSAMIGIVLAGFMPLIAASFVKADPGNWAPIAWIEAAILVVSAIAVGTGRETFKIPTADLGLRRTVVPKLDKTSMPEASTP